MKKSNIFLLTLAIVFLITLTFVLFNKTKSLRENEPPAPIPNKFLPVYEYYKLGWLDDGYPGRKTSKGLVAHPIYGTYIVSMYLNEFEKTKDTRYLNAAQKVANAAIARMSTFEDGLVFYYEPNVGLSSLPTKFYSALTQSRWLRTFNKLYEVTKDDRYKVAAEKVLASLAIPVERGGVLKTVGGGIALEEYPHVIPTYTLNGWLTTMVNLKEYAERGSQLANSLFEKNLIALEKMLPLYDVPELANSRYQLTNKLDIKFTGVEVEQAHINIPGEGDFPATNKKVRWKNYIWSVDGGQRMNAILSYASYPAPNTIHLKVKEPGLLKVEVAKSIYDPKSIELTLTSWVELGTYKVNDNLVLSIPWSKANLVAYPTAFNKKINGKTYNVYHFIHINALSTLYEKTKKPILKEYSDKWREYSKKWPNMSEYKDKGFEFESYNNR